MAETAFKRRREQLGLTLQEIGDALGISKQAVSAWDTQGKHPSKSHYQKLAAMLQLEVEDLRNMFGSGDHSPEVRARLDRLDAEHADLADQVNALRSEIAHLAEIIELALAGGDDTPEPGDPRLDG